MNKGRLPKCSTEHAGRGSYRSLTNKFKEIRICCFTSQRQEAEVWRFNTTLSNGTAGEEKP